MSEITLNWIQIAKLATVVLYASLYSFGGIYGKWKRRYVAPLLAVGSLIVCAYLQGAFSWWFLAWFPGLVLTNSLGYGADTLGMKVWKRAYIALAFGVVSLSIAIPMGSWVLLGLHTGVCLAVGITLGVINPISARGEETLIGATSVLIPMFMIG